MENSLSYVLIALLCSSILLSIVFLMAWFTLGKQKYTLIWSISFVVSICQWSLVLGKSFFDSQTLYWMLGVTCSMLSVSLGAWGHCLRSENNIKLRYYGILSALTLIAVYYFTAISPHIGLRMSIYLYYDVIMLMLCSIVILNHRKKSRPAEIGASIVYFLFALCMFSAATIALMQGKNVDMNYLQTYLAINFITLPVANVGIAFFVIYMLASDLSAKLEGLAMIDPLTQCVNRRGFYENAQAQIVNFHNNEQHVCLIYWDIDNFKKVNDCYGHSGGDIVLIETSKRVRDNIKTTDLIGRIGGEEFVILVGRTTYQEAADVAERLRAAISDTPIEYNNNSIEVTASFGVVDINDRDISIEQAIDFADKALYSAKRGGRNQVIRAE